MPGEGRGLGSRQTQQAVRDREIGQPNNSKTCSEAADGVTRESEGRSRLSLLCPVRQDQPRKPPSKPTIWDCAGRNVRLRIYSITSSACTRMSDGIVIPRAFAVFRFTVR